ncbi:MAG: glycosyltransferase family 2 protein [Acidobacteriaceae bacterium]
MKNVSIVTHAYNEEDNIEALYLRVRELMAEVGKYPYEHIFIDNASTDATAAILKRIATEDPRVKVIVNARNFGHIRSPMHALLQASGDAMIGIASDFQEPPDLIPAMLEAWEQGNEMVLCIKRSSGESSLFFWLRKRYYALVERLSSVETIQNYTGFGLYSRRAVDIVKSFNDPYPYFRGIIAEIGLPHKRLYFDQPARKRGFSKNNFYTLYDIAMLGITNLTKVPLRMMTFTGFAGALLSLLIAIGYLVAKLLDWSKFELGVAPLIIGIFFFSSIQLVFMGILGEYIGAIYTFVYKKPYAVEKERVGFQNTFAMPDSLSESESAATLPTSH